MILAAGAAGQQGRTALAVEALWDEINAVSDWEVLLDILLLDHSTQTAADDGERPATITKGRGRKNAAATSSSSKISVDEAWRLEEVEEAVLLEVLSGILRKELIDANTAKRVRRSELYERFDKLTSCYSRMTTRPPRQI